MLEVVRVSRRRPRSDGPSLLDEISFTLRSGDRVALVGPSGAGKTLALRATALLDPLDDGEVRWEGQRIGRDEVPRYRTRVVYVHQRPALIEETAEAALQRPFALRVHRGARFDLEQLNRWLRQLGRPDEFLHKRVSNLSGGEIQLTALLRALQLGPRVLLLDEPTAALDATTAAAVERLLLEWVDGADGRAFVWVGHDAAQSVRVANRTLRIEAGRLAGPSGSDGS
ncbi:MAG: ABC transporter ATP-binding protein [Planctomycetota bacterium]